MKLQPIKARIILFFILLFSANTFSQDLTGNWVGSYNYGTKVNGQILETKIILLVGYEKDSSLKAYTITILGDSDSSLCLADIFYDDSKVLNIKETKYIRGVETDAFQHLKMRLKTRKKRMVLYGEWTSSKTAYKNREGFVELIKIKK